jgi:adenylate kinase
MRLVLLGAPGAGKGSQAVILSKKLNIPHISTGDIFRSNIKNRTPLGLMAKEYIDSGGLVPDNVTIGIVKGRIRQDDARDGFILDGFPRTISQAESLDGILEAMGKKLDYVLNLQVPDEIIIRRLSGRRVCPECNANYHVDSCPPSRENICDNCGVSLIQREDDREQTVVNRLKTYHAKTESLINYYREKGIMVDVDGRDRISDTTVEIFRALGIEE